MMRKLFVVCWVVIFTMTAVQSFAEYNKEHVVNVMRANGASMGALKKAIESKDFFAAAETLMDIAKTMKSLETMTPPKGSKEEWDKNHQTLINMALKGIGACGDQDSDKLNEYFGEINKLIKEGHGMFK